MASAPSKTAIAFLLKADIPAPPTPLSSDIEDLHVQACGSGKDTYIDPSTGYTVFTALSHMRRGKCCGSACRHCPYAHQAVVARSGDKWRAGPPRIDVNVSAAAAPNISGAGGGGGGGGGVK